MPNKKPLVVAMSLVWLAASLPAAAQVVDPTQTRSTTRVVVPPPPPPPPRPIDTPRPTPPPGMPTRLDQRDTPAPIQAPVQRAPQRDNDDDGARRIGAQPAKVYDRNGRELSGMEQAGPNRVRDTRTGKYYDTVPSGDGQRIRP
ncbi:classical arabinogalactan protein 4 [Stenotrophomonas sp. HITSZ_GD]|uniref:classical arabinogalactan protein 4 n=1 Tax=Stenotrophomonas sp. HITSZ_GD TaxID=3037248 RepID=UPI00240DEF3C|nr:classical arabinogalactan protein 4 [Stenotrophomonas sp. HITSZ_GD]MDG2525195.1 classical arabinogalactan protein 4 [Stenotrophomonas sp. HITSZ_GD]